MWKKPELIGEGEKEKADPNLKTSQVTWPITQCPKCGNTEFTAFAVFCEYEVINGKLALSKISESEEFDDTIWCAECGEDELIKKINNTLHEEKDGLTVQLKVRKLGGS